MIEHIVLMKIKGEASQEQIEKMNQGLLGLKEKFEGILELTCGPNTSERSKGFTHGLSVRFDSQESLDAYMQHPDHMAVVEEHILPILDDLIVVDYAA